MQNHHILQSLHIASTSRSDILQTINQPIPHLHPSTPRRRRQENLKNCTIQSTSRPGHRDAKNPPSPSIHTAPKASKNPPSPPIPPSPSLDTQRPQAAPKDPPPTSLHTTAQMKMHPQIFPSLHPGGGSLAMQLRPTPKGSPFVKKERFPVWRCTSPKVQLFLVTFRCFVDAI